MGIHPTALVHPTAIIGEGAILEKGVKVDAYAIIGPKVVLGENTHIMPHAYIDGRSHFGANNVVYPYAALGTDPQDLKFNGEDTGLRVGDNNVFREYSMVNIGTQGGGGQTTIGNHNLIMSHTHIAHDCILKDHCIMVSGAMIAGHVEVGSRVLLGAACTVHQFVQIGEYAMIGAKSYLSKDVPPYCLAEGSKAVIRSLNVVGIRRNIPHAMTALKQAFKLLLRDTDNMKMALATIKQDKALCADPCVEAMIGFIEHSKRGIPIARS